MPSLIGRLQSVAKDSIDPLLKDRPNLEPIYLCRLETPVLSVNDTAERSRQGCIVMSDNIFGRQCRGVSAGVTIGDQHCIESKISCGATGAVDTVLGLHSGNNYAQ